MGRASVVLELLKKEVDICKLQADIGKQVEEKISKDQRRYFLQARPPYILLPPGPVPAPGDTTTYTVGSIGGLLTCSLPSAQRLPNFLLQPPLEAITLQLPCTGANAPSGLTAVLGQTSRTRIVEAYEVVQQINHATWCFARRRPPALRTAGAAAVHQEGAGPGEGRQVCPHPEVRLSQRPPSLPGHHLILQRVVLDSCRSSRADPVPHLMCVALRL